MDKQRKINRKKALEAIKNLLLWIGEDPNREGLQETPDRFLRALDEKLQGYKQNPLDILSKQFSETASYNGIIQLRDIKVESLCEHHLAPIIGKAHLAYIPNTRVVGLSKLARLVEVFAHRLQLQERLTVQIAQSLANILQPQGVAIQIIAQHHCMNHRGIKHEGAFMVTEHFTGIFQKDVNLQKKFLERL
jgi:GTP cyclohydrolase I